MADPLSQEILDQLPEDFVIEVAHLPDEAQEQVFDAARAAAETGELDQFDADREIAGAEEVIDRQDRVEDLRQEQAEQVADGDFAGARETVSEIQWEVSGIEEAGGEGEAQMLDAERDAGKLETAEWEDDTAADQTAWGARQAEAGDFDGAEASSDMAAGHAEVAADAAGVADAGGTYADHSYDATDATVDASTTE